MQGYVANYLLAHNKYLTEFFARNKPLLASSFYAINNVLSLVFAPILLILENFPEAVPMPSKGIFGRANNISG